MDQLDRRRALGDPEAASSAAEKPVMMAVAHSTFVMDWGSNNRRGRRWGSAKNDCLGALPITPGGGVEREYELLAMVSQECGLAARKDFNVVRPFAQAIIKETTVDTRWALT